MLRGNQQRSGTGTSCSTLADELLWLRERTGRARPYVVT
jgi:hypothetical protein